MAMFYTFAINIVIVVSLISIGIYIVLSWPKRLSPWILGVLFGVCTIFVIANKIIIQEGYLVDFRFIVMTLAGYMGGPITALVSAIISASYGWVQGGAGVLAGVITIFTFGFLGCLLRKINLSFKSIRLRQIVILLGLGFTMAVIVFLIILVASPWDSESPNGIRNIAIPLFILSPMGTLIIFLVYAVIREGLIRLSFFDSLLQYSSLMLIGFNNKGTLWASNSLFGDPILKQYSTDPSSIIFRQIPKEQSMNLLNNKAITDTEFHTADNRTISLRLSPVKLPQDDLAFVGILSDVTENKRTEKELAQLERLALVGEMAAAIGHEVRNPMTTVHGFLQLLGSKDEFSKYNEYFQLMIDELDRANETIARVLTLARNKPVQLEKHSLKEMVLNLFPLIQAHAMESNKYVNLELEEVPETLLDEKEMCQVILNLTRNGIESIPPGGKITIRTLATESDIVLAVEDEGKGIQPEVLERIGTPFFTTKESGIGLGLAVCYSIAARHNAKINIDTNSNGSTFYVRFKRQ